MSDSYWDRVRRDKDLHRATSAARPFEEKLRLLERMRERTQALRGSAYPISVRQSDSTSNVRTVALPPSEQVTSGKIQIGTFGANATLTIAATRAESSARATTTTMDRTK